MNCAWLVPVWLLVALAPAPVPDADSVAACEPVVVDGLTAPSRQAEPAFAVAGVLESIPAEAGQHVEQGALLAELNSTIERCELQRRRLAADSPHALRAAEVELTRATEELERVRELSSRSASSAWELRRAELEHALAAARAAEQQTLRDLSREDLRAAKAACAQRRMLAPHPGVVARTLRRPGEAVDTLKPVVVLVQLDPLHVELDVPAAYVGKIIRGQTARARILSREHAATVSEIEPLVDSASMTFRVRLAVSNPDLRLTAGLPARATLWATADQSAPSPAPAGDAPLAGGKQPE